MACLEIVPLDSFILFIRNDSHARPRPVIDKEDGDRYDEFRPIPCHPSGLDTMSCERN